MGEKFLYEFHTLRNKIVLHESRFLFPLVMRIDAFLLDSEGCWTSSREAKLSQCFSFLLSLSLLGEKCKWSRKQWPLNKQLKGYDVRNQLWR
jgi:hypothetical protein